VKGGLFRITISGQTTHERVSEEAQQAKTAGKPSNT
jgi:hypothetical protein